MSTPLPETERPALLPGVAALLAPLAVACPACNASRSVYCRTARYRVALGFHVSRRQAVADWSTAEKVAAATNVANEQDQALASRRIATEAVLAANRLTTRLPTLAELRANRVGVNA